MARTRSGGDFDERRVAWRKPALRRIKLVGKDLIEPQIRTQHRTVVRPNDGLVSVWSTLALWIGTRTGVLKKRRGRAERAVGMNRKGGDAAAAVVRHEEPLARAIDRHMARSTAAGRDPVQQLQGAGRAVDG